MKSLKSVFAIFASLAVAACAKEPSGEGNIISGPFTISATAVAPSVRTVMDETFATTWETDDQLNIFHAAAGSSDFVSDGAFGFDADNEFSGEISGGISSGNAYDWYAFYPYSAAVGTPSALNVAIPMNVVASAAGAAHLVGGNAPLYGKIASVDALQTPSFTMHHLLSIVEVVVYNNTLVPMSVSSVSLEADEDISGDFMLDISSGTPVFTTVTGYKSITLNLDAPVEIKPSSSAKFYFGIKPCTASSGSSLSLSVNNVTKSLTLEADQIFAGGKIKTLNFNNNGPSFTVNASGKKVVFSMGNLWYGHTASNHKFLIEETQNKTLAPETDWDGASFNGNYIQHFLWATTKAAAYNIVATDTEFELTDKFFASDGGAVEGWTVLTKDEWNYLLNERTVNGGKGAGYSYLNSGYMSDNGYKVDRESIKGLFIFPDEYNGNPVVKDNKSGLTWDIVNGAGIAYLPAGGGYSKRTAASDNGWVSTADFTGAYMGADIFTNSEGTNTFCTVRFNQKATTVTINEKPTRSYGFMIRLVKEVE